MTATRTLARSSIHTFSASVVGVTVGLGISVVVSRSLGPHDKGAYDLVISTATLLALLLGLSLPSGITFSVARRTSGPRLLAAWVLGFAVIQVLAAGLVLLVAGHTRIASQIGLAATDSTLQLAVPALVGAFCISSCLKAIVIGLQRVALANWLDAITRTLTLFLLLVLAFYGPLAAPTVTGFILATLIGTALGAGFMAFVTVGLAPPGPAADLRTVLRFSTPAYLANVLQYLNYRLDLFLVAYFRDLREVGLYALAATLAQLLWLVSTAVATPVFARVGSGADDAEHAAATTAALSRSVLLVQVVLALALAIAAEPLLATVYGSAFTATAPPMWLLLPGVVALGGAAIPSAHIAGLGRPGLNLIGAVLSLAVTLPLDLLLIPYAGMTGAAIASTASYIMTAATTIFFFARLTGLPLTATFLIRRADFARIASLRNSVFR